MEVAYDGAAGAVAPIATANGVLSLITLGFYRFWGKTRLRRYFWSHVSLDGDRLEYTGLAKELLIGFLIAIAILVPIFALDTVLSLTLDPESIWLVIESIAYSVLFWYLINLALFRARRYRLTRTSWRGIRFRQTGDARRYALIAMWWQFLSALTLGLAYPAYRMRAQRYMIEGTWIGTERFRFNARASELMGPWVVAWLLMGPTLGLSYIWYRVREFNHVYCNVIATGFRAEAQVRGGDVIVLYIIYLLATIAVLFALYFVVGLVFAAADFALVSGLLAGLSGDAETAEQTVAIYDQMAIFVVTAIVFLPFRGILAAVLWQQPLLRAVCTTTTLYGGKDLDQVLQAAASEITYGEGLADALDVGDF